MNEQKFFEEITKAEQIQEVRKKNEEYKRVINQLIKHCTPKIKDILNQLLKDQQKELQSRSVIKEISKRFSQGSHIQIPQELKLDIGNFILEITHQKSNHYQPVSTIRYYLSQIYEKSKNYEKALEVLRIFLNGNDFNQIPEEYLNEIQKMEICINAIGYCFELQRFEDGEEWLKRAKQTNEKIPSIDTNLQISLQIYDAHLSQQRKNFLQAGIKYYNCTHFSLLQLEKNQNFLNEILTNAGICGILAEHGENKQIFLQRLLKDKQMQRGVRCYDFLKKMLQGNFISNQDKLQFKELLTLKHQQEVLDNCIQVHNIFAASNIYDVIDISALAQRIGITEEKIQDIIQELYSKKKLNAIIDQEANLIKFYQEESQVKEFNQNILEFTLGISDFLSKIQAK